MTTLKNSRRNFRIISLVPSQTELLYDLGLEDFIVGITKFCVHPIQAKIEKKIVGGTKSVHLDKIKDLNPTIILCNKEENTKEIVEECSIFCKVHVSEIYTIEDTCKLIITYGELFDCLENAKNIQNSLLNKVSTFKSVIANTSTYGVAYFIWKNPWMVAANNTFINYLLELNNFNNVFKEKSRYPEIELESLIKIDDIDFVFLSSEPFPFKESHIEEIKTITNGIETILVDGEYFSWYGSRLLKAFDYFTNLRQTLDQGRL